MGIIIRHYFWYFAVRSLTRLSFSHQKAQIPVKLRLDDNVGQAKMTVAGGNGDSARTDGDDLLVRQHLDGCDALHLPHYVVDQDVPGWNQAGSIDLDGAACA
jgi:hypothetical protein